MYKIPNHHQRKNPITNESNERYSYRIEEHNKMQERKKTFKILSSVCIILSPKEERVTSISPKL